MTTTTKEKEDDPAVGRSMLLHGTLALGIAGLTIWGAGALWFQRPVLWQPLLALWMAAGAWSSWSVIRRHRNPERRRALLVFAVATLVLLAWWASLRPSQARDWADDVAEVLRPEVSGQQVTLHNVRNFDWRSESDYTARWETRRYDLEQLESADLILSYWMGPHIAHTLVSFGFKDGQRVVFSLEIRKERGEQFSAVGGFFRQFEQALVAADERDIIRTRSNARGEEVFIYSLRLSPEQLRNLFMGYVEDAADLHRRPRFYNTLTSNCTTIVFEVARRIAPDLPLDYRLLLSGHFAEYAHDMGGLAPGYPYPVLRRQGHINARAREADVDGQDFSTAIRRGVPQAGRTASPASGDRE